MTNENTRGAQTMQDTASYTFVHTLYINKNKEVVGQSNDIGKFTILPGQETSIRSKSKVMEDTMIVCEEDFRSSYTTIEPKYNSQGYPLIFKNTTFADPSQYGMIRWGYDRSENPVTLNVWDPSIAEYNVTVSGFGCTGYYSDLQTGSFLLEVRHLQPNELIFDAVRNVCPPISYDALSNTAGPVGVNPVYQKDGCSIVYKVENAPYAAEFGFLQIARTGSAGVVSDELSTKSMYQVTPETQTVDCYKSSKGAYITISSIADVDEGGSVDLVDVRAPSVFAAPYFSTTCDASAMPVTKSSSYAYSNIYFDNYLMMRIVSAGESSWIPIRKVTWGIHDMDISCNSDDACAIGLGPDLGGQYNNTAWKASGTMLPPNTLDAHWLEAAVPPAWSGVMQESANTQLVDEHTTSGDFWLVCPKDGGEVMYSVSLQALGEHAVPITSQDL